MSTSCAYLCETQTNVDSFDNAKTELLDSSLIRINNETGLISLHRLTQAAFFDQMSEHERERNFEIALSLLREAFPGRQGHHHLYTRWQTCEQLRQDVLAFQAQYEILRKDGFSEQDEKFTWLICDTAWQVTIPSCIAVRDQVPQDLLCLKVLARNPVISQLRTHSSSRSGQY